LGGSTTSPKLCSAKTLPVQTIAKPTLIAQQEMDEDSNAIVLMAVDDIALTQELVAKLGNQHQEVGFGWLWEIDYGICPGH
jgi:hypothetical protein